MGRRRWKFITIACFSLLIIKDTQCQDDHSFFYTPIERNFAQIHPPLYPSNRPRTFFNNGNFRPASSPQTIYNDNHVRLPSASYNQNPSPFHVTFGRNLQENSYFTNQPDVPVQQPKLKTSLPIYYQPIQPSDSRTPDIHSSVYRNNPSKPETFLGQITINNPDYDYLQNHKFRDHNFDENTLKNNGQSGHIDHFRDINNENLFQSHRVTTFSPNKLDIRKTSKINSSIKKHSDSINNSNVVNNFSSKLLSEGFKNTVELESKQAESTQKQEETNIEDDINESSIFSELMKNGISSLNITHGMTVNEMNDHSKYYNDNKPDASFITSGNVTQFPTRLKTPTTTLSSIQTNYKEENSNYEFSSHETSANNSPENVDEYSEYYDEVENVDETTSTEKPSSSNAVTDIYDEYDAGEEPETSTFAQNHDHIKLIETTTLDPIKISNTTSSNLLNKNVNKTITDDVHNISIISKDSNSSPHSVLEKEVVSVVTTKSVVNGTISFPSNTMTTSRPNKIVVPSTSTNAETNKNDTALKLTTENYLVVASVQTSRSISGARFLPFPSLEIDEPQQILTNDKGVVSNRNLTQKPVIKTDTSTSTENINDKLDSIQSELSSAVLSGSIKNSNRNIELIQETTNSNIDLNVTSTPFLNIFTLKSTQTPLINEKSSPNPPPVLIKKFTPKVISTTPKPRKVPNLVTVMDDLTGLLPPGYKPRQSFKDRRVSTTTKKNEILSSTEKLSVNSSQGRSSGLSSKNKIILLDDKSLLPKEFKIKTSKGKNDTIAFDQKKLNFSESKQTSPPKEGLDIDRLKKFIKVDVTAFLPKNFIASNITHPPIIDTTTKNSSPSLIESRDNSTALESILDKFELADISSLLPPDFKVNKTTKIEDSLNTSTQKSKGGIKLFFPTKLGIKPTRKNITLKLTNNNGPSPVTPKIQKGWPTRASTEFTGWPSPSTTPFSIEKLLEAQRNATATLSHTEPTSKSSTWSSTNTVTTTVSLPSTTPGICQKECDIAATIKLISGVKWVPELLDQHTEEWQQLAKEVKEELNSVYSKSEALSKWYKGIRIDGFSQGSVLVDYFIELKNVEGKIDTNEFKMLFHESLNTTTKETKPIEMADMNIMLGDQPQEDNYQRLNGNDNIASDGVPRSLEIGKFWMDPAYTEFIVLPKREAPTAPPKDEEALLPQWGIAVIVIALASLLFVVIFGVTVMVNRQKSAKAKQPIPLSEDMLRELDKSHMGGFEDAPYHMKERELPYLPSGKRMSTAFIEQSGGDSWRSEWTPQLRDYMRQYAAPAHGYATDDYGYSGTQTYGRKSGSQLYGYGGYGDFPRAHSARRHIDYDPDF